MEECSPLEASAASGKPQLWTRTFLLNAGANFLTSLNFYLLMVVVSGYAMTKFACSAGTAGFTVGIFIFGALAARFLGGRALMRFGARRILGIGLAAGLLVMPLYWLADGIGLLLAIRFLHGIAFGLTTTVTATIAATIVPAKRRGEGIGYFALSMNLASATGPFLGMYLSHNGGYTSVFVLCTGVALLACLLLPFIALRRPVRDEARHEEGSGFRLSDFIEPAVIPISAICLVMCLCYSSILSFLTVYAREIHLVEAASFFFVVFAVSIILSRPTIGRMFDRKGENSIMYPAIIAFACGMVLCGQSQHAFSLLLAAVCLGLGFGSVQASTQAIAVKLAAKHRLGLANATFFMFCDLGIALGSLLAGLVIPEIGFRNMYTGAAFIALGCLFFYYVLHGKHNRRAM